MLVTGFHGSVKERYRQAILEMNASRGYVISVDINSGMNGDSGAGETVVCSDLTVTVQFVKQGQLTEAAAGYMKRLVCVDIGIADTENLELLREEQLVPRLDTRLRNYISAQL